MRGSIGILIQSAQKESKIGIIELQNRQKFNFERDLLSRGTKGPYEQARAA
jgi:hypothetical protein